MTASKSRSATTAKWSLRTSFPRLRETLISLKRKDAAELGIDPEDLRVVRPLGHGKQAGRIGPQQKPGMQLGVGRRGCHASGLEIDRRASSGLDFAPMAIAFEEDATSDTLPPSLRGAQRRGNPNGDWSGSQRCMDRRASLEKTVDIRPEAGRRPRVMTLTSVRVLKLEASEWIVAARTSADKGRGARPWISPVQIRVFREREMTDER